MRYAKSLIFSFRRSCACQGVNQSVGGASFSFGCSWSMYSNTCKFCKSGEGAKKFKLLPGADSNLETVLENKCHRLADAVAPVFKRMAPACYRNQVRFSNLKFYRLYLHPTFLDLLQ